jgi:hypothetical protein
MSKTQVSFVNEATGAQKNKQIVTFFLRNKVWPVYQIENRQKALC